MEKTIQAYLHYLENADYPALMTLFAEDAVVVSPLYGERPVAEFYRDLFQDTTRSRLTFLDLFTNPSRHKAAVNFCYEWTLADGTLTSFDCIDVFEFDPGGRIRKLKIIYDTAGTRPAFEKQKQGL